MFDKENSSFLDKVKENGTITLDELVSELTRSGIKGIDFSSIDFGLDDSSENKKELFENDMISSFGESLLQEEVQDDFTEFDETFLPGSLDRQYSDSRDYQLLDCVVEGNFEVEDAERILMLINKDVIKKYIISKITEKDLELKNYVFLLADLKDLR